MLRFSTSQVAGVAEVFFFLVRKYFLTPSAPSHVNLVVQDNRETFA